MPYRLLKYALNKEYPEGRMFRVPERLKNHYEVVIIGGGGHGLAAAYYLARDHGITDVAVLEQSYLGSGGTGRNTAIVRSNYLTPEGVRFYDESVRLFQDLSADLDLNLFYSERGHFTLAHTDATLRTMRWRARDSFAPSPRERYKSIPWKPVLRHRVQLIGMVTVLCSNQPGWICCWSGVQTERQSRSRRPDNWVRMVSQVHQCSLHRRDRTQDSAKSCPETKTGERSSSKMKIQRVIAQILGFLRWLTKQPVPRTLCLSASRQIPGLRALAKLTPVRKWPRLSLMLPLAIASRVACESC